MSFPRIDHPEFAEFIRRFYGVIKEEPDPLHTPARERAEVPAPKDHQSPLAEDGTARPTEVSDRQP